MSDVLPFTKSELEKIIQHHKNRPTPKDIIIVDTATTLLRLIIQLDELHDRIAGETPDDGDVV
jgi:hypothetical protein